MIKVYLNGKRFRDFIYTPYKRELAVNVGLDNAIVTINYIKWWQFWETAEIVINISTIKIVNPNNPK